MGDFSQFQWLGWQGSNLRMTGSKPAALPLGYTPKQPARIMDCVVVVKPLC